MQEVSCSRRHCVLESSRNIANLATEVKGRGFLFQGEMLVNPEDRKIKGNMRM